MQARHRDLQPFDRGEHRDRRGDHAVAVEQRGADDPERDQRRRHDRAAAAPRGLQQRRQRHDAALAAVVGAHDEREVLDRHDDRDRPEHERDHAVDVPLRGVHRVIVGGEDRLQRVQRAGPDVAEHHAQRTERERRHRGSRGGAPVRPGLVGGLDRRGEALGGHRRWTVSRSKRATTAPDRQTPLHNPRAGPLPDHTVQPTGTQYRTAPRDRTRGALYPGLHEPGTPSSGRRRHRPGGLADAPVAARAGVPRA